MSYDITSQREIPKCYDKDLEVLKYWKYWKVLEIFSTCTENMPRKQSLSAFHNTELQAEELEGLGKILKQ